MEVIDGNRGELTILVDGQVVAEIGLLFMPSVQKVLAAVRKAEPVATQ